MSLALARKYRPKCFAEVAVQSHVSTTLKGAIARGRVAHGYLLCGPRGTGKTTLARVLAMALNCERRIEAAAKLAERDRRSGVGDDAALDPEHGQLASEASEPCGQCASCQRIWSGSTSLDVVEIDAASNRGVDDARDLRERAMYAPSGENGYKVYIVDEAHMLTREAWNALLKILEEPPPRVVFVFATTDPQKIMQAAAPVLSRVQRFDLKRIGPAEIRERVAYILAEEGVSSEPEALAAIARAADGSMRDALSLTDQVLAMGDGHLSAERVRDALGLVAEDEFIAILDLIADRRAADVFPAVARLAEAGIDFGAFLTGLADMLRAQLSIVLGSTTTDISERARTALQTRKDRFVAADLLRMLQALGELEPRFRKSGQQQMLIETLLVRFALLDRSIELEEVLRSLGASAASGGGEGGGPDASARSEPKPVPRAEAQFVRPTASSLPAPRTMTPPPMPASAMAGVPGFSTPVATAAATATVAVDVNRLTGQWDALVERLKADGKMNLAAALAHSSPVAVTASGAITIELDESNDFYAHSIHTGRSDIVAALGTWFTGVDKVELKRDRSGPEAPPKRLTDEMVRAERLASLKKRDPVLGAAIDALDLDVVD